MQEDTTPTNEPEPEPQQTPPRVSLPHSPASSEDDDDDAEFEQYQQLVGSGIAGVAPTFEESLGQRFDAWGPGINGETINDALLPLYNDIPAWCRTRQYWDRLVEGSRNNMTATAEWWVAEAVRLLRSPENTLETMFGWKKVTRYWKTFLLLDPWFRPQNITPKVWISMLNSIRRLNPHEWQRGLLIGEGTPEPGDGDPANYVSKYVPTIATSAPPLKLNPLAWGPIPSTYDISDKKFPGELRNHPEYWGDFVDDGPRKEGESLTMARNRITSARSNMGIIRRPVERIPPLKYRILKTEDPKVHEERNKWCKILYRTNKQLATRHDRMMDEKDMMFNPEYREAWRKQQKDRREENDRRREAAYKNLVRHYRHMKLPIPPKPDPPEDSEDDNYYDDITDIQVVPRGRGAKKQPGEYRCQPCAEDNANCSYKTMPFPCQRCVSLGIEDRCVSSVPVEKERFRKHVLAKNVFYVPSFALPLEPVEHHVLPEGLEILGRVGLLAGDVKVVRPLPSSYINPPPNDPTVPVVMTQRKRRSRKKADEDDGAEPPAKRKKVQVKVRSGKGRKPTKPARPPIDEKKAHGFEPCDAYKLQGEEGWCEPKRPCSNCVLNGRGPTCATPNQNLPYTTFPSNTISSVGRADSFQNNNNQRVYQSVYSSPAQAPPPLGYDNISAFGGLASDTRPPPELPIDAVAPYSYLRDDIVGLYDSRRILKGIPETQPQVFQDVLRAFVAQDSFLRQSDPSYIPLTTIDSAEAYYHKRFVMLLDQMLEVSGPQSGTFGGYEESGMSLQEVLVNREAATLPMPQMPVTEADMLRDAGQQPHSAAQDLENFHGDLAIRQTNLHEPGLFSPEDALDAANYAMDWTMTDDVAPLWTGNNDDSNNEDYNTIFDSMFQNPDDGFDAFLSEPAPPAIPPMGQGTSADIESALEATNPWRYPLSWRLENMREGYDVEVAICNNQKETAPCTEDRNCFTMARGQVIDLCPNPLGIVCDGYTCDKASCRDCWTVQSGSVQFPEMNIIARTKAWFCKPCKNALDEERLRNGGFRPRLNRCHCVSQLQETRVCNEDRLEAGDAISKRADEQKALAAQEGKSDRCGHCKNNDEDPTSGAWRCRCCNQIVTLP